MNLLWWVVVMFGVWVALNIVVFVIYAVLDHNASNSRDTTRKWEHALMIHEGTSFQVAIIAIVVMGVLPAFLIADWRDLLPRRGHPRTADPTSSHSEVGR